MGNKESASDSQGRDEAFNELCDFLECEEAGKYSKKMHVMSYPFNASSKEYTEHTLSSLDSSIIKPSPYLRQQKKNAKDSSFDKKLPVDLPKQSEEPAQRFTLETIQKVKLRDLLKKNSSILRDLIIDDSELDVIDTKVNKSYKIDRNITEHNPIKDKYKRFHARRHIRNTNKYNILVFNKGKNVSLLNKYRATEEYSKHNKRQFIRCFIITLPCTTLH